MPLNCGIVGLPNVGKSTIFNALTSAKAQAANYPFCTIDPNTGVVSVPDERLQKIADLIVPKSLVPTTMEFIDIAGLVAGASKGEGLGNQFLGHIRATDAIAHVVRCFEDDEVIHVAGGVNPLSDMDVINTELLLADLDTVEKRRTRTERAAKSQDAKAKAELEVLDKLLEALNAGRPARTVELTPEEKLIARELFLITAKPQLYVANVDEAALANGNAHTAAVEKRAKEEGAQVVRICGALESEIALLEPEERLEFLADMGLSEPGLNRLIRAAYTLLDLITYFTAGVQEVRAWTIRRGTKAPGAAGVIHSDFERGFIKADCYASDDLFALGSEQAVKEKGLLRSEGKEYVVKDGDILFFKFNV
ncbi:redox-regulated ATPase YchF [Silvibacterium dinghuense]|uniref:Ribosome-binding ATPase YchF n=1 Tax=Silvibacterium dinghuense TaxID=1560006 RepID=A0A4Q1SKX5_9BACT|nr:redox-regulated ATPase YchF [Silvibacterium dinghuense]RXS97960.1 redox-regulated ATPase YchF [Silvibacterium dinghuense]GGH03373.1 ribosome-binding ATPase YchF [Silvibacterium dinghuense]